MTRFYAKVKGVIWDVEGEPHDPHTWHLTCEHTGFQATCMACVRIIQEGFTKDDIEVLN